MASSFDLQAHAYRQLLFQHHDQRRQDQGILLDALDRLSRDVSYSLIDDKQAYDKAKGLFHRKYNRLQRIFTHSASRHRQNTLQPLKLIYHQRRELAWQISELLEETQSEANPLEVRTHWNGSIAVVYNPTTGRAEWRQSWHGGIHGVFNPVTDTVEWRDESHAGIYGVFNPKLNIVEWKKVCQGGVHGVYNPWIDDIEWQISFHSGIGGVYNPLTKEVEWRSAFKGGVVGYFDYESQTVKWIEKWHHGLALIIWDETIHTYRTTSSSGWYGK